jgi:hypothetical protein
MEFVEREQPREFVDDFRQPVALASSAFEFRFGVRLNDDHFVALGFEGLSEDGHDFNPLSVGACSERAFAKNANEQKGEKDEGGEEFSRVHDSVLYVGDY